MTIKEFVKKYNIMLFDPDQSYRKENGLPESGDLIKVYNIDELERDDMVDFAKEHKPEIIECLKEREHKIESIPGLKELEKADADWDYFKHAFNSAFDAENGSIMQARMQQPDSDPASLRKKYPQADAYLQMKDLVGADNWELSAIGDRAIEMVIDGDWQEALEYADREQQKLVEKHLWD